MSDVSQVSARERVVERLRVEHQELLLLLASYVTSQDGHARRELLNTLYAQTHLHYTAELGVFYCALEPLPAGSNLMNEGAEGYARATALANELTALGSDERSAAEQIHRLRDEILWHIKSTEAADGPFALSSQVDTDWEALERELSKRRLLLSERFPVQSNLL